MTKSDQNNQLIKRVVLTAIPLLLLVLFYTVWMLSSAPVELPAQLAAAAITFLFALLGIRFIPQWIDAWSTKPWQPVRIPEGRRSARADKLHPFFRIVVALAAFRILLFVAAYGIQYLQNGYTGGVFDTLDLWNRLGTDGRHYLSIAQYWYAPSGDDRLLLVFLPFYPILVRAFRYIFQNYLTSGLFVSNVCCVFAGYVFYELALLDTDKRSALRSLKFLCLLPASFLLSAPLSDSLFLLLSVSCIYFLRKDRYVLCGFMGMLASFTRMPGLLLVAPVCFELVGKIIRESPEQRGRLKKQWLRGIVGRSACVLLIPLGFAAYLLVNRAVSGDPMMFLTYQRDHWHQQMGWFYATVATQVKSLLAAAASEGGNYEMLWGLWVPNLFYLFASLGVVIAAQKKLRASNVAYFILYYLVCMGATWLLSAPRYLTACYPLALSLGSLTQKRWANVLATVACIALQGAYLMAYVNQWYVY